ncbi:MAG: YbaK/EbsC family protein [Candidatus Omnitrophica bacterium]|nr:YbaK/EbsC family protein [Candidatus Omnitrophota bacterium]
MSISAALKSYLDQQRISYTAHKHAVAYTAQELAAAQHVPGRKLAKCVVIKTNAGLCLAVLPATHLVDFAKLKQLLKAARVKLASEADIKQAFPDAEVGAMPPFGNLYRVPTVVDAALAEAEEIVCNGGSHTDTISLRYADYARLVNPKVGVFGLHVAKKAGAAQPATTSKKTAKKKPAAKRAPAKRTPAARKPARKPAKSAQKKRR